MSREYNGWNITFLIQELSTKSPFQKETDVGLLGTALEKKDVPVNPLSRHRVQEQDNFLKPAIDMVEVSSKSYPQVPVT